MLSRENRWSSKSHHACMFGRVVTEVNAVKIRLWVKFSRIKKTHRASQQGEDKTFRLLLVSIPVDYLLSYAGGIEG